MVDAHGGAAPLPAYSYKEPLRLAEHLDDDGRGHARRASTRSTDVRRPRRCVVAEDKGCEEMLAFATSAVRDAGNSDDVLDARRASAPASSIEVLSGEDEARLTFLAVRRWFGWSSGRLAVFDIGGGSLEIAGGADEAPDVAWSLPLGAARLAARRTSPTARPTRTASAQLRQQIRAEIARDAGHLLRAGAPDRAVATSKTFRSLARICGAAPSGDGPARAARRCRADELREWIPKLVGDDAGRARRPARRLAEPHPPDRARARWSPRRAWTSSTSPSSRSARGRCARA